MKIRVENYQDYLRISEVNTLAFTRVNEANLIIRENAENRRSLNEKELDETYVKIQKDMEQV